MQPEQQRLEREAPHSDAIRAELARWYVRRGEPLKALALRACAERCEYVFWDLHTHRPISHIAGPGPHASEGTELVVFEDRRRWSSGALQSSDRIDYDGDRALLIAIHIGTERIELYRSPEYDG